MTANAREPAPLGLRWLAYCVDLALQGSGMLAGAALGTVLARLAHVPVTTGALFCTAAGYLLPTLINWWLITSQGQSMGKRWADIRIVRTDGRLPGFLHGVVLRSWTMVVLSGLCSPFWLADALFVFRADRRTLHDLIASTRVEPV